MIRNASGLIRTERKIKKKKKIQKMQKEKVDGKPNRNSST
jgi:hypothetical protein